MNANSTDSPTAQKTTWQERYARWMLKPRWGQKWFYKYHWYLVGSYSTICIAGALYFALVAFPITMPATYKLEMNTENLTQEQQEQVLKISLDLSSAKNLAHLCSALLRTSLIYFGVFVAFIFLLSGFINEERKGYKRIIERLENELAEARKQLPG